jgi:hypothetical protein
MAVRQRRNRTEGRDFQADFHGGDSSDSGRAALEKLAQSRVKTVQMCRRGAATHFDELTQGTSQTCPAA